jgi:hypothetical protein
MENETESEVKDHSIVENDLELRPNHVGEPVTYREVTGKLIRYIPPEGSLLNLTLSEAFECLEENRNGNGES